MEPKQPTPSIIARLMGFDEFQQPQQSVIKRQRVLSENYLSKVGPGRVRGCRRSSGVRVQEMMKDASAVSEIQKRSKQQNVSFGAKKANLTSCNLPFGDYIRKPDSLVSKHIVRAQATPPHRLVNGLNSVVSREYSKHGIHRKYGKGFSRGGSNLKKRLGKEEKSLRHSTSNLEESHMVGRKAKRLPVLETESLFVEAKQRKRLIKCVKPTMQSDRFLNKIPANSFISASEKAFFSWRCRGNGSLEKEPKRSPISTSSFLDLKDANYISSSCHDTSSEEVYQPSPISVLEPAFKEVNPESFRSFPGFSFHDLEQQQLGVLSDGSEMIVSSDDESMEQCSMEFKAKENKIKDWIQFSGDDNTLDLSYMDDILTKTGFSSTNHLHDTFKHSSEFPMDFTVFQKLEKNYANLKSQKRSERRLLFDRVNSCLVEILKSPISTTPTWKTSVARRVSLAENRFALKDEIFRLLAAQENHFMKKRQSGGVLAISDCWLELGEEIELIVREAESMLVDELVAEVVSLESN